MTLAVGEQLLDDFDTRLMQISSAFAGGVAGTREELCGVLGAAAIIVGALYGRSYLGEDEERGRRIIKRVRNQFVAKYGTSICAPIRDEARGPSGPGSCTEVVRESTQMLMDALAEDAAA